MSPPIIPLSLIGMGMYLCWFGIHYWDSNTKFPTDPLKAVLQGKPLPAPAGQTPASNDPNTSTNTGGQNNNALGGNPPSSGQSYTIPQLQTLWTSNGGSSSSSWPAANVAWVESSGRPAVTSANPDGGVNVGLWQLDTKGVGAGYTTTQLSDPDTNAKITIMHSANGTNWSKWANPDVSNGAYIGPGEGSVTS